MLHVFFYFHSESVLYLDFGFASQYESVNQDGKLVQLCIRRAGKEDRDMEKNGISFMGLNAK